MTLRTDRFGGLIDETCDRFLNQSIVIEFMDVFMELDMHFMSAIFYSSTNIFIRSLNQKDREHFVQI